MNSRGTRFWHTAKWKVGIQAMNNGYAAGYGYGIYHGKNTPNVPPFICEMMKHWISGYPNSTETNVYYVVLNLIILMAQKKSWLFAVRHIDFIDTRVPGVLCKCRAPKNLAVWYGEVLRGSNMFQSFHLPQAISTHLNPSHPISSPH